MPDKMDLEAWLEAQGDSAFVQTLKAHPTKLVEHLFHHITENHATGAPELMELAVAWDTYKNS